MALETLQYSLVEIEMINLFFRYTEKIKAISLSARFMMWRLTFDSQPLNPELRNIPENFHPCMP